MDHSPQHASQSPATTRRRWRLIVLLLVHMIPLLACMPFGAVLQDASQQRGPLLPGVGTPIPFDELPLNAPCRRAAEFALTTDGLLYSQGGNLPNDPIDPVTGGICSRTGPRCYDCSGMTNIAYSRAGVQIGATTYQQINDGTEVPCTPADLNGRATTCWATGDLAVFLRGTDPYHVAMYIRDGVFAECMNHNDGCRVWERPPSTFGTIVVRRIVGDCVRSLLIAVGDIATQPTSYTTTAPWGIRVTYTGWHAQVLHYLFSQVPGYASTYTAHDSVGGGVSVDLWTTGAVIGVDNSSMATMDALAEYIAANLDALGIKYVIWEQRSNYGDGWTLQRHQGNVTDDHKDHIHITFDDAVPGGTIARGTWLNDSVAARAATIPWGAHASVLTWSPILPSSMWATSTNLTWQTAASSHTSRPSNLRRTA